MKDNVPIIISESYRQATLLSGKAACWINQDGRLTWTNMLLQRMLGYEENEMPTQIFEINPTLNLLIWRKYWKDLQEIGYLQRSMTLMTNQENIFSTTSTGMCVKHGNGNWCCLVFDYPSVEKEDAMALVGAVKDASARMMKHTVDNAREMFFWIDRKGDYIYVNKKVLEVTGYSSKEFRKFKAWKLFPYVQNPQEWEDYFEQTKRDGQQVLETKLLGNEGRFNYVDVYSTYVDYEGVEYIFSVVRDITERKEQEALLQKMKYSFDHARDMFSWVDENGSIIYVNDKVLKTTGYTRKEVSELKIWQFNVNVQNKEEWKNYFQKIKKVGQIEQESKLLKKNGKTADIDICTNYIDYEGNEYLFSIVRNITKKKKKDALLQKMKYSFDNAKGMITWINEEGEIIYGNNQFLKETGYKQEELEEIRLWNLDPNISKEQWKDMWQRFKSEKRIPPYETSQRAKDGRVYPVEVSGDYLEHDGTPYLFAVTINISNRKKRDALLQKMKYSFDNAQTMISWFDEKGKFLYTNEQMSIECDYTIAEILEMYLWDISPNITEKKWREIWNRFKKEKVVPLYKSFMRRRDDSIFPIEISGHYLSYEGKEYLFILSNNISKREENEAELRNALAELKTLKGQLEGERNYLQQEIIAEHNFNEIITQNREYRQILQSIQKVADTDATVLILGETGTGKELIARALHNLSNRRERPMIKVNCASLPANLIESELFGHEKGAFTGAFQKKIGRFELADKGTIFLDEIGELPIDLQAKLLRALQEGEYERLGGNKTIRVDVRVIVATNRNLEEMIAAGTFREDLYYRINVFPIVNPPLRMRKDDIPVLVNYFLQKYSRKMGSPMLKVSKASIESLMNYEFPGNIRELENLVERAIILSNREVLNIRAVLPKLEKQVERKNSKKEFLTFEEVQRTHIIEALNRTHWKVTGKNSAAELLKMNGKTLASKMKKLNIQRDNNLY